jgi:hypothetical protein
MGGFATVVVWRWRGGVRWSVWRWKGGVVEVFVDWHVCLGGVRAEMGVWHNGENEGEWGNYDLKRVT